MQIVIDIPKQMYLNAKADLLCGGDILVKAIKNGTPLPKGHGRLIDADALYEQYAYADYNFDMAMEYAPTIIEADRKENHDGE